jgi:hypothetical protein
MQTRSPSRLEGPCAYCRVRRAVHADHVIPKSLQKKYARMGKPFPAALCETVGACAPCNWLKLTLRLVPPSWADRLDEINALVSGTPFRVWAGDPLARYYGVTA